MTTESNSLLSTEQYYLQDILHILTIILYGLQPSSFKLIGGSCVMCYSGLVLLPSESGLLVLDGSIVGCKCTYFS